MILKNVLIFAWNTSWFRENSVRCRRLYVLISCFTSAIWLCILLCILCVHQNWIHLMISSCNPFNCVEQKRVLCLFDYFTCSSCSQWSFSCARNSFPRPVASWKSWCIWKYTMYVNQLGIFLGLTNSIGGLLCVTKDVMHLFDCLSFFRTWWSYILVELRRGKPIESWKFYCVWKNILYLNHFVYRISVEPSVIRVA